jgi:hypothetical protein
MDIDVPPGVFESPLRRRLAAMPANERQAREELLKKMSALELTTANMEAREKEKEGERMDGDRPATPDTSGTRQESEPADPFHGIEVLSPLRRKTMASVEDPSDSMQVWAAVNQLRRLSTSELVRENNIARNKEMLAKLGLDKSFNEHMGITKGAGKRTNSGGTTGRKVKRARRQGEKEADGHSEEEDDEDEDDEEDDAPRPAPHPAPRPLRAKPAAHRAAPKEWVVKAKKSLEEDDMGPKWVELVGEWYRREEGKGFISPVSSISLTSARTFLLTSG